MSDLQTTAYETTATWRAGLSKIFGSRISVSQIDRDAPGVIGAVQRGCVGIYRLSTAPQIIVSKPNLNEPGNLVLLIQLAGSVTHTGHRSQRRLNPGEILPLPLWGEFSLEIEHGFTAVALAVPIWWTFDKGTGPEKVRWLSAEDLFLPADFFLNPVLLSAANALLRTDATADHAAQAENLFGAALVHTLNAASLGGQPRLLSKTRFHRVYDYITRNVATEGLSPRDAAEALKISVRTLHQACADNGTTFNRVLAELRLGYAAYLLRTNNARISEVAFATGYGSLPHFCRQFREKFGISAKRYRTTKPANASRLPDSR